MTFTSEGLGMSLATSRFWALLFLGSAALISWPSFSQAQEPADALLAASATEASILATQMAGNAYSQSGDATAAESFQSLADEVAGRLQLIASESALGKG